MMMHRPVPVVDLFAGPGGLGEGFSGFRTKDGTSDVFRIAVSVEKDHYAHRTLELRSFFRQFRDEPVPDDYYRYLRQKIGRDVLFARHPEQARSARDEARLLELGKDNEEIYRQIERSLDASDNPDWLLIGGPPCQAYSVMGRSRMRAANPEKFDGDPRHTLYREYLKILALYRPSVFVMENVRGILSSRHGGELIFPRILSDLREPGKALQLSGDRPEYRIYSLVVEAEDPTALKPPQYIIQSERFGVPQMRHRVILLGVRADYEGRPRMLQQMPEVTARQALEGLPRLRSDLSKHADARGREWGPFIREILERAWFRELVDRPSSDSKAAELVCMIRKAVSDLGTGLTTGAEFMPAESGVERLRKRERFVDPRIKGVCNHSTRTHMPEDLHRYLFAACYSEVYRRSPTMREFPPALLPLHKNVRQKIRDGADDEMFEDRFRVQVGFRPANTITSHISKDGHFNIHFDPAQCRSLTVREAARLQTFPDNYFFEGPRTEQYHQVGNAVPPFLALQIAGIVFDLLTGGNLRPR